MAAQPPSGAKVAWRCHQGLQLLVGARLRRANGGAAAQRCRGRMALPPRPVATGGSWALPGEWRLSRPAVSRAHGAATKASSYW